MQTSEERTTIYGVAMDTQKVSIVLCENMQISTPKTGNRHVVIPKQKYKRQINLWKDI